MSDHSTPPPGPTGPDDRPGDALDAPGDPEREAVDELVSAYLDGMATPAEIERMESDDELIDAMGSFAQVSRAMVDDLPPMPAGAGDRAMTAAMAAFDERDGAETDDGAGSPVVSLAERRPWVTRIPFGAAAAAVVVVLVGAVALVSSGSGNDDATDTAAPMAEAEPSPTRSDAFASDLADGAADDGGDDAMASEAADGEMFDTDAEAPTAAGTAEAPTLRIYESSEQLLEQFGEAYAGRTPTSATAGDDEADADESDADGSGEATEESAGAEDPCDSVRLLGFDPTTIDLVARVEVDGVIGTAVIDARPDGDGFRIGVVADDGCRIVLVDDL